MQVEVSKYTKGKREKMMRPNGLSESLIQYDSRLQDKAMESVTELAAVFQKQQHPIIVQVLKHFQHLELKETGTWQQVVFWTSMFATRSDQPCGDGWISSMHPD
jgi:hypothetical protein